MFIFIYESSQKKAQANKKAPANKKDRILN